MRERTKWTIQNLTEQVHQLTKALQMEVRNKTILNSRLQILSEENDSLRLHTAALQLRLLGRGGRAGLEPDSEGATVSPLATPVAPPWENVPLNLPPNCMSDQILQSFLQSKLESGPQAILEAATYELDVGQLFVSQPHENANTTATVVGDLVRSYKEIETLPKQVAVHYVMATLMKVTCNSCLINLPLIKCSGCY